MQHSDNPIEAEKHALRDSIKHQVQQFLQQGGKITILDSPSNASDRHRGGVSQDHGDESVFDDLSWHRPW